MLFLVQVKAEAVSSSEALVPKRVASTRWYLPKLGLLLYKYECKAMVVGDFGDDHHDYHNTGSFKKI